MFDQLIESSGAQDRTKKPMTMFISIVIHVVLIIVLVIIPLLFPETLSGSMQQLTFLVAPPPPPPPPAPATRCADAGESGEARRGRRNLPCTCGNSERDQDGC
jgi:hypothetical protein